MTNRPTLPPLNALRAFEAAGRSLSFRQAADMLGVTQGAVAQQVRGLEARLGLKLFERRPEGLAFSPIGRGYHAQVVEAFSLLRDATEALGTQLSQVTVSVTPTIASKWLIPRLPDLVARHPDIDLRVLATETVSSFHSDGIDLAIRQARPPFGASLRAQQLFRHEVIAVCSPALVGNRPLPLDGTAMSELTLLHDTHALWPQFYREVLQAPPSLAGRGPRLSQTSLALDAALAGQGIALASRFLIETDLKEGRLIQPVPGHFQADKDFYLLARNDFGGSPAVEFVFGWLKEIAGC